jgi:hypothetical protein
MQKYNECSNGRRVLYRGILLGSRLRPENVHMLQGSKSIVAKKLLKGLK